MVIFHSYVSLPEGKYLWKMICLSIDGNHIYMAYFADSLCTGGYVPFSEPFKASFYVSEAV